MEGFGRTSLGNPVSRVVGSGTMIHITAQLRVLVATKQADARKGIDSLVLVCQGQLCEDPFSSCVLCSGAKEEHRFDCPAMTAMDIGWRRILFLRDGLCGGQNRTARRSGWPILYSFLIPADKAL